MPNVEAMADMVILAIKSALAPVQARQAAMQEQLAGFEARWSDLGALRERVAVLDAKADTTVADLQRQIVALEDLERKDAIRIEGYTCFLQRDMALLSERTAVVETRTPAPGPPGQPGPPGPPGTDGKDGIGIPGLSFEGVYQDGKSYDVGHLVTWAGSSWHCNEPTTTKPGDGSKAWTLMVKRGRDGKDGRDALDPVPVVKVGG